MYDRLLIFRDESVGFSSVFVLDTDRFLDGTVDFGFAGEHPELAPRWQVEMVKGM